MRKIEAEGKSYLILEIKFYNYHRGDYKYSDIINALSSVHINANNLTSVNKLIDFIVYKTQQFVVTEIPEDLSQPVKDIFPFWSIIGMEIKDFVPNAKEKLWLNKSRLQNEEFNAYFKEEDKMIDFFKEKERELKESYNSVFEFVLSLIHGTLALESKESTKLEKYHLYLYKKNPYDGYSYGFIYAGDGKGLDLGYISGNELNRILRIFAESKKYFDVDTIKKYSFLDTRHKMEFIKNVR